MPGQSKKLVVNAGWIPNWLVIAETILFDEAQAMQPDMKTKVALLSLADRSNVMPREFCCSAYDETCVQARDAATE
jgi:hypothetical protein